MRIDADDIEKANELLVEQGVMLVFTDDHSEAQAEIARLQAQVDRHQALITKMFNARRNYVKHIRNATHNAAIEAMQAHIKPKSITDWDVKEPDYYYALAHEHMWEDLEFMKR